MSVENDVTRKNSTVGPVNRIMSVIKPVSLSIRGFFENASLWIENPPIYQTIRTHFNVNPLEWPQASRKKSDFYPIKRPENVNQEFFCVGCAIDNYALEPLTNPVFDLMNFSREFCHGIFGIPYENATILSDFIRGDTWQPTRDNIVDHYTALVEKVNNTEGGVGVALFSGHGARIPGDESDGKNEALVTKDLEYIMDNELAVMFGSDLLEGKEIYLILDCCFSGGQDFAFMCSANELKVKPNPEASDIETSKRGRTMVFATSLESQKSSDGPAGTGGAGSQAFRYALKVHGVKLTGRNLLKTAQRYLVDNNYKQIVTLQSTHEFDLDEPFFSEATLNKITHAKKTLQTGRSIDIVIPKWQQKLLKLQSSK